MTFSPSASLSSKVAKRHPMDYIVSWVVAWALFFFISHTSVFQNPVHRAEGDDILQALELTGDQSTVSLPTHVNVNS